jgi:2-polyprenyl-6-methoxyphenol hydroxylase-like FAD-dependent oxidoreductase
MDTHSPPLHSFDVVIVGAGISGIDAAYRIQSECPSKSYTVFEARSVLGGTWDLFRCPGVRGRLRRRSNFKIPPKSVARLTTGDRGHHYRRDYARCHGRENIVTVDHSPFIAVRRRAQMVLGVVNVLASLPILIVDLGAFLPVVVAYVLMVVVVVRQR